MCDLSCSGYTECVKWLIANRAKVDVLDNNGRTPLDIAEVNHNSVTRYWTAAEMNQEKVNCFNEQHQSCAFEKNVAVKTNKIAKLG